MKEHDEHMSIYPTRDDRMQKWREKAQDLRERKRKMKLMIQELERLEPRDN